MNPTSTFQNPCQIKIPVTLGKKKVLLGIKYNNDGKSFSLFK